MTTRLMPPEMVPAGPERERYLAALRQLGVDPADLKFNPNHDRLGRFAHAPGGGGAATGAGTLPAGWLLDTGLTPPQNRIGPVGQRLDAVLGAGGDARAIQTVLKESFPQVDWDVTNLDPSMLAGCGQQFERLAADYPEIAAQLVYVGSLYNHSPAANFQNAAALPPGSWAIAGRADGGGYYIALNPQAYAHRQAFADQMFASEATRFHPAGCASPEAVFTHEFGHIVQFWTRDGSDMRRVADESWARRTRGRLEETSGYGRQSWALKHTSDEAFAETFVAAHYTPDADQVYSGVTPLARHVAAMRQWVRTGVKPDSFDEDVWGPNPEQGGVYTFESGQPVRVTSQGGGTP